MERKLTTEMKVGIFVFTAIIAVIGFIFTQTRVGKVKGYEIGVLFDYIGGLEIGSPVRVSGVRVGEVKKIDIIYDVVPKVLVKLKINHGVKIGKHSRITVRTLGIIGERYIEITPSSEKEFIEKGEIVEGENPLSIERIANIGEEIASNLNKVLYDLVKITGDKKFQEDIKAVVSDSKLAISKINNSFDKISNLVEEISETNKHLKTFLEENSPKIKKVIVDTDEFIVSGKKQMEETMAGIRDFVKIKDKAEETLSSFADTSSQIKEFFGKLEKQGLIAKIMKEEEMIDDIKKEIYLLKETTLKIGNASEKLSTTLEDLNSILNSVKRKEGSVGKLLYSDELYNEIMSFIKDIKAHPWKLFFRK